MPAPRQDELIYDPNVVAYGDPVLSTARVGVTALPVSSKPSGATTVGTRFVSTAPTPIKVSSVSKIASEAQFNKSLQTFLQTGVVDQLMMEGFAEMGPSVSQTEWLSIQKRWGLTNAQLNSMKTAHANYLGLAVASPAPGGRGSAPDAAPMPMTEPEKKPNYLLWAAIAVGGFFIVRKFLK